MPTTNEEEESGVIDAADLVKFITGSKPTDSNGRIFSVDFIKRTSGEMRHMVCRYGVQSRRAGGDAAYDFKSHNLLCVFDMQKDSYRSIPVENVVRIKINGKFYRVKQKGESNAGVQGDRGPDGVPEGGS